MEKPILFSTPMVQAILEGRKTMTRTVIKPQPSDKHSLIGRVIDSTDRKSVGKVVFGVNDSEYVYVNLPYEVGDILWVRETWCRGMARDGGNKIIFKANIETELQSMHEWKPSIHMPRSAARLFLKVINVRVERLQEIPAQDIAKEGANDTVSFLELWDKCYQEPYQFIDNPWVWVVEFEKQ